MSPPLMPCHHAMSPCHIIKIKHVMHLIPASVHIITHTHTSCHVTIPHHQNHTCYAFDFHISPHHYTQKNKKINTFLKFLIALFDKTCSSAQHGLKLDTMDHIAVGHIGLAKEETITATKFCFL